MSRPWLTLVAIALPSPLFVLAACSSSPSAASPDTDGGASAGSGADGGADGGAGTCPAYTSTADLTTPVTFTGDGGVMPLFQTTCAAGGSAACHGDPSVVSMGRPYLGNPDASALVASIVGVKSNEDPKMNLVTAGDPTQSFLMHKMDGDQCSLTADCVTTPATQILCGSSMPFASPVLPTSVRDTVRAWIAQGAPSK